MLARLLTRMHRVNRSDDAGVALPMVMGTMFILTVLMLTSLSLVLTNTRPARADQDSKAALAAAQAGVDEYISRLTSTNGQYWTNAGVDPTNPAMDPNPATPQCEGGGRTIPGAGANAARFCYRVMTPTTETAKFGYIKLQVTGTSQPYAGARSVSRTLSTTLRPDGFIDFIYYTDVEVLDPVLLGDNVTSCSKHYYEGRGSGCTEIQWGPNDVIDGPMHSNDALQVGGSVWFKNQRTESSWDKANKSRLWWGSGTPKSGAGAYWPIYKPTVPIPPGNEALLKYVKPKIDTDPNTDRPGCLYSGSTRITFVGNQMKVLSPNTTSASTPSYCLDVSNRSVEQTKPIPPVIYVKGATGTCSGVGYPISNEYLSNHTTDYTKCRGTAYVQGNVAGQVTISAVDDVVVTGNLTANDVNNTDVIGLIAGNYVWIYHPVRCTSTSSSCELLSSTARVKRVDAAILSLRHSILVQNWDRGADLGSLTVYGALAQKFRGPVGTTANTGYDKDYIYDTRFKALQPPYFLSPDNTPWRAAQITDGR